MDKKEELKKYIAAFLYSDSGLVTELVIDYTLPYPFEYAPIILAHQLVEFSNHFNEYYYNQEIVENFNKALESNEFDAAYEIIIYEWRYAFLPLTITWDMYPKMLSRKIMVPLRNTLADAMYAILASFRCAGNKLMYSEIADDTFITLQEENNSGSLLADEFPLYILTFSKKSTLTYDYMQNWTFTVKPRKITHIFDSKSFDNVILENAVGYGIYEENKYELMKYLVKYEMDGINDNNSLPFDFFETNIAEFKKYINEEFEKIKLKFDTQFLVKYYEMTKDLEEENDSSLIS